MEITALGRSGFRLRSKDVALVIDPPSPAFGTSLKGVTADIVCVTHQHPGHNYVQGVGGEPHIVNGPGEYEIKGVLITALRAFHDAKRGEERGNNTIYVIHMEDLLICHLGDIGHPLSSTQTQEVAGADVLMIPVGGKSTINARAAAAMAGDIEPSIILPMHFGPGAQAGPPASGGEPLDPVEAFFTAMGIPVTEPLTKLVVTRSTIPTQTQVTILIPRG